MGFFDSVVSSVTDHPAASILGALQVGSQIWGAYNADKNNRDQIAANNQLAQDKLAEDKRQFDLTYALKAAGAGGGGGGGGGGGDAMKIAKSRALQGAYQSLIDATQSGRQGEAQMLSKLVDQFRAVNQSVMR